jgi:hypothetical protein
MRRWMLRSLCTWWTCVVLALSAAPAVEVRTASPWVIAVASAAGEECAPECVGRRAQAPRDAAEPLLARKVPPRRRQQQRAAAGHRARFRRARFLVHCAFLL